MEAFGGHVARGAQPESLHPQSWSSSNEAIGTGLGVVAVLVLALWAVSRRRRGSGHPPKMVLRGMLYIVLALMGLTCFPYYRYGESQGFLTYAAFAFPCMAGLIAGIGTLRNDDAPLDYNGAAFVVSGVAMCVGYALFIYASTFWLETIVWVILLATGSVSVALLILFLRTDVTGAPADGLFVPTVIGVLALTAVAGILFFLVDPAFLPVPPTVPHAVPPLSPLPMGYAA